MRYHFIPTRMTIVRKMSNSNIEDNVEKLTDSKAFWGETYRKKKSCWARALGELSDGRRVRIVGPPEVEL